MPPPIQEWTLIFSEAYSAAHKSNFIKQMESINIWRQMTSTQFVIQKSLHPTVQATPWTNNIPRWAKSFVLLESWTFCCPVLDSRHCTRAYTCTVTGDPARQPGISQPWYHGTVLYGSRKLGSTWQKMCGPPPFSHLAVLFIYGPACIYVMYKHWLLIYIIIAFIKLSLGSFVILIITLYLYIL